MKFNIFSFSNNSFFFYWNLPFVFFSFWSIINLFSINVSGCLINGGRRTEISTFPI